MAGTVTGTVVLDVPGVQLSGTLGLQVNTGTADAEVPDVTIGDDVVQGGTIPAGLAVTGTGSGDRGRRPAHPTATSRSPRPAPGRRT